MIICEIAGCNRLANGQRYNGGFRVRLCDRCANDGGASFHCPAVYFSGRWHGLKGYPYTAKQRAAFPGVGGVIEVES